MCAVKQLVEHEFFVLIVVPESGAVELDKVLPIELGRNEEQSGVLDGAAWYRVTTGCSVCPARISVKSARAFDRHVVAADIQPVEAGLRRREHLEGRGALEFRITLARNLEQGVTLLEIAGQ